MDQVQNAMLQMMQAVTSNAQPAGRNESGKDDFRKLMEQQKNGLKEEPKAETAVPQDGEQQEVPEEPELEKQMLLAAAAMLQNPVVTQIQEPVEAVEETVETETAAVEAPIQQEEVLPEVRTSLAERELPKVSPDGTMTVQEGPAEKTVSETPAAPVEEPETVVEKVEVTRSQETGTEDEEQETPEDTGETAVFRDLKAVPVKVGEAETPEKTQESKPVETQIGEKLTEALESGETRVEIQLTPEHLGKVTIEVTLQEDGTLHVALRAENSQTRGLLERDLSGLQSALARNTQQEVRVEVQREQESRNFYDGEQGQDQRNPHQQQHRDRRSRESEEDFLHQLRLGLIPQEGE